MLVGEGSCQSLLPLKHYSRAFSASSLYVRLIPSWLRHDVVCVFLLKVCRWWFVITMVVVGNVTEVVLIFSQRSSSAFHLPGATTFFIFKHKCKIQRCRTPFRLVILVVITVAMFHIKTEIQV